MSLPIEISYQTGAAVYAIIHNASGQVWNTLTKAFENYNSGNWALYAVSLAEQVGSGYYYGAYPAEIVNTLTTEVIYERKGGAPALSDAPGIGIGQTQGTNIVSIAYDAGAAANLSKAISTEITGAVVAGTLSITQATTDLPDVTNNVYNGRLVIFTSGPLIRQAGSISAYNGGIKLLTFSAMTQVPNIGDTFIIV